MADRELMNGSRSIWFICHASLSVFGQVLVTHVSSLSIVSSYGQTSDAVINKHLEARNLGMWDMIILGAIL